MRLFKILLVFLSYLKMFLICFFLFNIVSLFAAHTNCPTLNGQSNALIHELPSELKKKIFDRIIDNGIGVHTFFDNQNSIKWQFDYQNGYSLFLYDNNKVSLSLSFQNGAIVNSKTKKIFFPDVINLSLCCKQLYEEYKNNKLDLEFKWFSKRCLLPIKSELSFQEVFFDMGIPTLDYLRFEKSKENKIFIFDDLKYFIENSYFEFKPQIKYLMYLFFISKIIFNDSMNFQQIYLDIYPTNQNVFALEYNSSSYERNYSFFVTTFILSALYNTYVTSMKDDYLLSMIKRYYSNFQTLFQENKELQQKIHFIEKIFDNVKNIEDGFSCIANSCELFFQFLKDKEMQDDTAKKIDMFNNEKKIIYYYFKLLEYSSLGDFIFHVPLSGEPEVIKSGLLEIRKSFVWSCLTSIKSLFIQKYCDTPLAIAFFDLVIPSGSNYFYLKRIKPLIFHLIHLSSDVQNVFAFFHYVDLGKLNTELEYFYINGNPIFSEDMQALFIHNIFNDALLKTGLTKESFSKKLTPDQEDNLRKNLVNGFDFFFQGPKANYLRLANLISKSYSNNEIMTDLRVQNAKNEEKIESLKDSEYFANFRIQELTQINTTSKIKLDERGTEIEKLTRENIALRSQNNVFAQKISNVGKDDVRLIQNHDSDLKNQRTIKKLKKFIIFLCALSVSLIAICGFSLYSLLKKNYSSV